MPEYARQVRRSLDDLSPTLLQELLEDLDEHLAEVAVETDQPLEVTLGPPTAYAQELRRAADLPETAAAGSTRVEELRRAAEQLSQHQTVRSVLTFLPELRPAWWVLRGWLAVVALGLLAGYQSLLSPFGVILGLPLITAAIVLSVRLGRRAQRRPFRDPRQRMVMAGSNAVLALVAVGALVAVQQRGDPVYAGGPADYSYPGSSGGYGFDGTLARPDGSPITNIYPYSADGRPLTGVLLYDQDGRALDNLSTTNRDGQPVVRVTPSGSPPPPANAYPHQQRLPIYDQFGEPTGETQDLPGPTAPANSPATPSPTGAPNADLPPSPEVTPTPEVTPSPEVTATPEVTASPVLTPSPGLLPSPTGPAR